MGAGAYFALWREIGSLIRLGFISSECEAHVEGACSVFWGCLYGWTFARSFASFGSTFL